MIVNDDHVIREGGLLREGALDGVADGLRTVIDGDDDRGLHVEVLFAEVDAEGARRVEACADLFQMAGADLLHLHLHLAVGRIDVVELLLARGPQVGLLLAVEALVQMEQLALPTQVETQIVESAEAPVGVSLLGPVAQQLGPDEPQAAEVEVVAHGPQLVIDGGVALAVGIDHGGPAVVSHERHTLQGSLAQSQRHGPCQQRHIALLAVLCQTSERGRSGHRPRLQPYHVRRQALALTCQHKNISHGSRLPEAFYELPFRLCGAERQKKVNLSVHLTFMF